MQRALAGFPSDLIDGYLAFKIDRFPEERTRYQTLADRGQNPKTLVICCCDSRAAPETIFNAAPGALFVLRNVANLVPPYEADDGYHATSAGIEFAVNGLLVKNIVVMGHGRCGGVHAFLLQDEGIGENKPLSPANYVGRWITLLEPAKRKMACDETADFSTRKRALEEAGIKQSIENLLTFPFVKTKVQNGELALHGAWFEISSGALFTLDGDSQKFIETL